VKIEHLPVFEIAYEMVVDVDRKVLDFHCK
jgi:hypothetical protein